MSKNQSSPNTNLGKYHHFSYLGPILLVIATVPLVATSAKAAVIGATNFDSGVFNLFDTTITPDQANFASGDMFGVGNRTSPLSSGFNLPNPITDSSTSSSDTIGVVGQNKTDNFFGVVDLTNPNNPLGNAGNATFTFNFGQVKNLTSISIDIGAMGDFEDTSTSGTDELLFTATLDGNAIGTLFEFKADTSIDNFAYRPLDNGNVTTFNDPLVETTTGAILNKTNPNTGALDTFTFDLTGLSGQEFVLIFNAIGDGGSEAFAFDNIVIEGEDNPSATTSEPITILGTFSVVVLAAMLEEKKRTRRM